MPVTGLHHVTAITGPAQQTVDFVSGRLGLRLVKRTVNFDDPGTYHLYWADDEARPGSVFTAFPWAADAERGRAGEGQPTATAWAAPPGAVDRWADRFADDGFTDWDPPAERFGERVLTVRSPDGLVFEIVETGGAPGGAPGGADAGGADGPGRLGAFHSVTLCSTAPHWTLGVLVDVLGYREAGVEDGRTRLVCEAADRARYVDLWCEPGAPGGGGAGRMGAGTVHHVAFRVPSSEAQAEVREALVARGLHPTDVRDRQYFRSVYVREPGGVLFEIATDPPGFAVDEPADALGHALMLPPQYEPKRDQIEARLPAITVPTG